MDSFEFNELQGLSSEQKELALQILQEYADTGRSDIYENLIYQDYKELPVDIDAFIDDDYYLGKAWHDNDGRCKMYPYWRKVLKDLFPDPYTTTVNNLIESGARGLGKSEIGVTVGLYLMHRVMCLKNAQEFFGLKPTEKIAFAFMNITKILAEEIGIAKFQATVQMSPWFMERGQITGRDLKVWNPPEYINIIIGSQASHVIGQPIYFAMFDEISFIRNQDIDKQKRIAIDMIDTAIGGMKTRFIQKGKNPTCLVLASSKRSEKSFLEEHMKKKLADESEDTYIVDEPVWNVKPPETYSGIKFKVGVGNRFLASEIIPDGADVKSYIDRGFNVISVPIEFKTDFKDDIDRALCDFAGISSSELTKYISGLRWKVIKSDQYENPFKSDVIEVGNAPTDDAEYRDFFDVEKLDKRYIDKPLYVHFDMSKTGDKTGIAGVWVIGKKPGTDELYYKLAFSTSIKAPKGYEISFAKNRKFIYWLREESPLYLKGISSDTFQNVEMEQDLLSKGYPYSVISVDRVNQNHVCEPYAYLKNCIYEERLQVYDCELLTQEILQLEKNNGTGKVDHPDGQSKDQADALTGAIYNASLHAEEYAFEYGDSLDGVIEANAEQDAISYDVKKKQIELDMEELLKDIYSPKEQRDDLFKDFGLGAAQPLYSDLYNISKGIVC